VWQDHNIQRCGGRTSTSFEREQAQPALIAFRNDSDVIQHLSFAIIAFTLYYHAHNLHMTTEVELEAPLETGELSLEEAIDGLHSQTQCFTARSSSSTTSWQQFLGGAAEYLSQQ
jgi:hypothetical protein